MLMFEKNDVGMHLAFATGTRGAWHWTDNIGTSLQRKSPALEQAVCCHAQKSLAKGRCREIEGKTSFPWRVSDMKIAKQGEIDR